MKFYTFAYGTGGIVYGTTSVINSVTQDSGPSTGGAKFVARGDVFEYDLMDDQFNDSTLDTVKWTDISSSGGSVSEGSALDPGLSLTTGVTPTAIGGITSKASRSDSQVETRVRIPAVTSNPPIEVNLYTQQLYIDATNYANIEVNLQADGEIQLICKAVAAGTTVASYVDFEWTSGLSVFKILRWGTDVYFFANGIEVYRCRNFSIAAATHRMFATNLADAYSVVNTLILSSTYKTFIVFGDQPVHDAVVISDHRLIGYTPPSVDVHGNEAAYKGLVDVTAVGATTSLPLTGGYEYYYPDRLTLLDNTQYGVKLSKIDDLTVRTPQLYTVGLGGGK